MGKFQDLTGQKFGRLTVIKLAGKEKYGTYRWLCKCECGNEVEVRASSLKNGNTKSCGCYYLEKIKQPKIDLTGKKFGRLTVLEYAGNLKWKCQCECGTIKIIYGEALRIGATISCGCYQKEIASNLHNNLIHGKTGTRLYYIWHNIKCRCYRKNDKNYKNYGNRGIKMCDEWKNNFQSFYDWATLNGYNPNAKRGECTIDRIDNNKGYCPENCRFVNNDIQANNKTNNHYLSYNGKSQTIAQWARELNINVSTLITRVSRGWNDEKVLTTSIINNKKDIVVKKNRR